MLVKIFSPYCQVLPFQKGVLLYTPDTARLGVSSLANSTTLGTFLGVVELIFLNCLLRVHDGWYRDSERRKKIMGKCAHTDTAFFLLVVVNTPFWWECPQGPRSSRSGTLFPGAFANCLLFLVVVSKLSAVPGISSVHEVHVWELVSGKVIATLHIKYQKDRGYQDTSRKIREIFHGVGIHNVTIQFEQVDLKAPVEQKDLCSSPCISKGCEKQLCCPPGALPLAHVNGCAEHNGCPPLDTYRSGSFRRQETAEVAIEVSLDSCLSDHGQALSKTQEDQHYVNSTHFWSGPRINRLYRRGALACGKTSVGCRHWSNPRCARSVFNKGLVVRDVNCMRPLISVWLRTPLPCPGVSCCFSTNPLFSFEHLFQEANCASLRVRDVEGWDSVAVDTGFKVVLVLKWLELVADSQVSS